MPRPPGRTFWDLKLRCYYPKDSGGWKHNVNGARKLCWSKKIWWDSQAFIRFFILDMLQQAGINAFRG